MKKLFIFAMALGLAACTTDKSGNNGTENGDADVNYLSINIISADGGTRADYNSDSGYEKGDLATESNVSSIRFYFFDENGTPAHVNASGDRNYKDWPSTSETVDITPGGDDMPNIEQILQATVILEKPAGSIKLPYEVIAVINPNQAIKDLGSASKSKLLTEFGQYFETVVANGGEKPGRFVMSNSVYATGTTTGSPEEHCAVSLEGHLYPTMEGAQENPVTIHVERILAKVELSYGAATTGGSETLTATKLGNDSWGFDTGKTYREKDPETGEYGTEEKPIYVRFDGFNVTATANKEYLIKHINKSWPNVADRATNLFQTPYEPWNYSAFFRSFWAINPTLTLPSENGSGDYNYGIYNKTVSQNGEQYPSVDDGYKNVNPALGIDFKIESDGKSGKNIAYLPENAGKAAGVAGDNYSDAANALASQVIIAATLVNEAGNPLDLGEYIGVKMLQEDLATYMLGALSTEYSYYDSATSSFKTIAKADVEFKTAWQLAGANNIPDDGDRLYVYLQLKDNTAITGREWYDAFPASAEAATDEWKAEHLMKTTNGKTIAAQINETLKYLGPAKIWNGGATYYFFDIRHLANPVIEGKNPGDEGYDVDAAEEVPGYYGVVRNHVYRTTITSLVGLGTPVYDPDEIIIPEKPGDEKVNLAAEIRILSWRIVNSDVTLDW